ncbi:MAG: DUF1385 domain-containing protein [Fibrobacterota bacterium]
MHNAGSKKPPVGGQAVIEGVMMRGPAKVATVVRRADGSFSSESRDFVSLSKRNRFFGLPVIRGAVTLFESLSLGFSSLSFSADMAMEDEKKEKGEETSGEDGKKPLKERIMTALSFVFAFLMGIAIFMALPYFITGVLPFTKESNPAAFNLAAGFIRVVFFLIYVYSISFLKDIKAVFQYHGAEHKSIFCYEAGEELTVENCRKYTTKHPRCGTSFLLIAALSCIIVFAAVDSLIALFWRAYISPEWYLRVAVHIPLIPLVSGISYELLKFADKYKKNPVLAFFNRPGLLLQNITTQEPDDRQIETAIKSLKEVL